jgi:hypothetical protein
LAYALIAVAICEIVGAVGFHALEGFNWIDAIYEESMLATGQGPTLALTHDSTKVFASVMAFVSVGSTFSTITLAIVPFLARLWHEARVAVEEDARELGRELSHGIQTAREDLHRRAPPDRPEAPPPPHGPGES